VNFIGEPHQTRKLSGKEKEAQNIPLARAGTWKARCGAKNEALRKAAGVGKAVK